METFQFLGLGIDAWITIVTVLGVFAILMATKLRTDLVFLGAIGLLFVTGVLDAKEAFSGFSSTTVVLVGVMSVVVAGLTHTGVLHWIIKHVLGRPKDYKRALLRLNRYLTDNDLDVHLAEIRRLYKHKSEYMIACIEKYFPAGCRCTHPDGGMFLWVTLPDGVRGIDVQRESINRGFAVCAGDPFYEYERNVPHIRLNFSNGSDEQIDSGMRVVGEVIKQLLNRYQTNK